MEEFDRNGPCPCGSGRRGKRCHLDPSRRTRLQHELHSGHFVGVFVDETVIGIDATELSEWTPKGSVVFNAVVVPPNHVSRFLLRCELLVARVQRLAGVSHLHFTDLINGNQEYKHSALSLSDKVDIVREAVDIVVDEAEMIVMQTGSPARVGEMIKEGLGFELVPGLRPTLRDITLQFLLGELGKRLLNRAIQSNDFSHIKVLIEEYEPHRAGTRLEITDSWFADGAIDFFSKAETSLAAADLAAFGHNRLTKNVVDLRVAGWQREIFLELARLNDLRVSAAMTQSLIRGSRAPDGSFTLTRRELPSG